MSDILLGTIIVILFGLSALLMYDNIRFRVRIDALEGAAKLFRKEMDEMLKSREILEFVTERQKNRIDWIEMKVNNHQAIPSEIKVRLVRPRLKAKATARPPAMLDRVAEQLRTF